MLQNFTNQSNRIPFVIPPVIPPYPPRTSRQTPALRPRYDSVSSSSSDIYDSSNNSYEQDPRSTTANTRTFEDQDEIVFKPYINFKCRNCDTFGHVASQCKYSLNAINRSNRTTTNSRGCFGNHTGTDTSTTFSQSKFNNDFRNKSDFFQYHNQYNDRYNHSVRRGHINPTNEQVYQFRKKGHVNPHINGEHSYHQYQGHVNPQYHSPVDETYKKGHVNPQVYGRNFKKRFDKANYNPNRLQSQYVKANSTTYKPRTKDHHSAPLLRN